MQPDSNDCTTLEMYAAWLAEISGISSYFSSTYMHMKAFEISQLVM